MIRTSKMSDLEMAEFLKSHPVSGGGALFAKLTKAGVQDPNGQTSYFDNPGKAIASASAATAQPGTSSITGPGGGAPQIPLPTITSTQVGDTPPGGVGPMQTPDVTVTPGQDRNTVGMQDAPIGAQPKVVHPNFADANAAGGPFYSPELTTKGRALSLLLSGVEGAANGMAASMPINGGHTGVGVGPALAAGFQTPFMEQQKRNALINEQLEQQEKQAQIQNIPLNRLLLGADIQNKQSGTAKNFADATAAASKGQLDLAEALTKPYVKGDDGQMFLAGQDATGKPSLTPVQGVGVTLPVDNDLAHSIGRDDLAGKFLPSKTVEQLKQIADAGQTITSANGRQLIVKKSTGEVIKDLGTATPIMTANIKTAGQPDARLDKSYQYNQGRLDKIRAPIDTLATRFGRLQDTINQNSPQADALVAPELLSVMAGGQGSGLRMNEAEIARIVGGRSKWQSLQAAVNQWSTDPKSANSITPDQRAQIRALVSTVGQKVAAKQGILSQAGDGLLDAPDVQTHRKILADTQNKLDAVDSGASASVQVQAPDGSVHTFADQTSANNFKKLAGIQ
jgi:uncharacterized protein YlzI (FlbEa/FlbD family)